MSDLEDYEGQDILIGLSAGINSAAVLCWLVESGIKPKTVHLYYAHFYEHSPDSFQFVADLIRYARKHFNVKVKITKNSILGFFKKHKMILHPMNPACSDWLKIRGINKYAFENDIKIDLVGYVKHELKRRSKGQISAQRKDIFSLVKKYPIGEFTDEWCFDIVKKHIGWYPQIYGIINDKGERVFKHNNCLPCKNMYPKDIENVRQYYPEYYQRAIKLSSELGKYWGRNEVDFYTKFGRDLGQENTCQNCKF